MGRRGEGRCGKSGRRLCRGPNCCLSPTTLTTYPPLAAPSSPWTAPRPVPPLTCCSAVPRPTSHRERKDSRSDRSRLLRPGEPMMTFLIFPTFSYLVSLSKIRFWTSKRAKFDKLLSSSIWLLHVHQIENILQGTDPISPSLLYSIWRVTWNQNPTLIKTYIKMIPVTSTYRGTDWYRADNLS